MLHRETSAYTTAYRRPAVYFYVTDFPIMSNWNIVCNINTHILLYYYDIEINNRYTQKSVSLRPICLDATYYGRPACNRKLVISYTYLQ